MASNKISQKVLEKQIDQLYQQLPFSLLVTVVVSFILFLFLPDFPDKSALRIWITLTVLVVLFRAFLAVLYYNAKKQSSFQVKRYETLFLIGVVLAGTTWGGAGGMALPHDK